MRVALALLVAAALAGCGGPRSDVAATRAPAAAAIPAVAPRFGDADPHAWGHVAPQHYPVHGIDVSKWQGAIDWAQVRASGVAFAFIKATEGGDVADERFAENWAAARAAGVPRGAYHFYYFCRPAAEQARWFAAHVPRDRGALPPVLDMEWNHLSRTCPHRPAPETVRAEMLAYKRAIAVHYGRWPIVYTTVDFYRDNELWRVEGTEFWLRSVAGHPSEVYPGQDWTFWQYTGTGVVPGIGGAADINVFGGTRGQWAQWLSRRAS